MNRYFFGAQIVSAIFFSSVGLLVNLDVGLANNTEDSDSQPGTVQRLLSPHGLLDGISDSDVAYAEAMQEHISHLA